MLKNGFENQNFAIFEEVLNNFKMALGEVGMSHKGLKSPKRFTNLPEITT